MIGLALLTSQITKGKVARYTLLPEILPRLNNISKAGFGQLAFFMALVFRAVNILPPHHPYLKTSSIGKFAMYHVLSEASSNLKFNMKHIDQVIVFFALMAGIVILVLQFIILMIAMFSGTARAQGFTPPAGFDEIFVTANPDQDLALRLLDMVFGIPDFFNSQDAGELPFHTSLHGLLQFYSFAILVVAAIILAYFVFAVVAETAQSGTPFGKRYNHIWAPIRLIAAFGLLIPISFGLNSAQWITLYAAKFGSAFATNGWLVFNDNINNEYLGELEDLVGYPNTPSNLKDLAQFMFTANACKVAYVTKYPDIDIRAWLIETSNGGGREAFVAGDYDGALDYYNNGDIHIRFGEYKEEFTTHSSRVFPYCGEIVLQTPNANEDGAHMISAAYYDLVAEFWFLSSAVAQQAYVYSTWRVVDLLTHVEFPAIPPEFRQEVVSHMEQVVDDAIFLGVEEQRLALQSATEVDNESEQNDLVAYGWGGAAIWYNKIAQYNGALVSSAMNTPTIRQRPAPMEFFKYKNLLENANMSERKQFDTGSSKGKNSIPTNAVDEKIGGALNEVHLFWIDDDSANSNNVFIDTINLLFGTAGLFDMCENTNIHPLAQISSLGKGLVESAVRNIGLGFGFGFIGLAGLGPADALSSFMMSIASITILIGFILFYVVPFMPFLYFLFAVGGWVKGIFEAMVGVPLWALAHLRIDGNGLAGEAALNGYFLIFEIFIRPILIVFGLLAAISIFGAMVKILHETFALVVSNLSGFNGDELTLCGTGVPGQAELNSIEHFRGPVDELFFTVVYAILVYMIGMSCFKLIDMIPNQILRWMGMGVSTFNDQAGEPAEGLTSRIAIGGGVLGGQLGAAGGQLGQAAGGLAKAATTPGA